MSTPLNAVHQFCVECVGSPFQVESCGGDACKNGACDERGVCWFYHHRLGKGRVSVKTIRKVCLWCMGDREDFVRECKEDGCALHRYRMGKNPARSGQGDVEKLRRNAS